MIIKSIIVIMLDLIIMIGDVCVCTCVCMCLCGLICSQKYEYLEGYDSKCGIFFRTIGGALNLHCVFVQCVLSCTQIHKYANTNTLSD